jgi:glycosyltransferase involved in cell wall biosynthesis
MFLTLLPGPVRRCYRPVSIQFTGRNGAFSGWPTRVTDGVGVPMNSNAWINDARPEQFKTRRTVTVTIPTLNEEKNIEWVLRRLPPIVDEVIIVDGYSSDRTIEVAKRARPDAVVVSQVGRGKGAALRTAFRHARGEYIVMLDSDCSMDPSEIERFVQALDYGYDFAKGSRYLPGGESHDLTLIRSMGNRALTSCVNLLFAVPFTDLCYGYIAFRHDKMRTLELAGRGFEIETEMVLHAVKSRLRIAEIPSEELGRRHGSSNLRTFQDGYRILRKIVSERIFSAHRPVVDHFQIPEDRPALSNGQLKGWAAEGINPPLAPLTLNGSHPGDRE